MRTNGLEIAGPALITGASRGIGRVIALRLAAAGSAVAVNYRQAEGEAHALVGEITAGGGQAVALRADMSDARAAVKLYVDAERALGSIRILVNNAGLTHDRLLVQMSSDDWDRTWLPDLGGPRALSRYARSRMASLGYGRIINVGSVVGTTGNAGQANYAAAKSALEGITRHMAVACGSARVTVNCVVPGYILTAATAHLSGDQQQRWLSRIPLGRYGNPDEIATVVAFLASAEASYVTGQCIAVDGGFLAASAGFSTVPSGRPAD